MKGKYMRITAIMDRITGSNPAARARKYAKKYVKIEDFELPDKPLIKLQEAKDTIANYAKSKKVKVKFYSPWGELPECHSAFEEKLAQNKIAMQVTSRKNSDKSSFTFIDYTEKDGKPFLRTVYEQLQLLTEKKPLRIEKEKADTITRLLEAGKIK